MPDISGKAAVQQLTATCTAAASGAAGAPLTASAFLMCVRGTADLCDHIFPRDSYVRRVLHQTVARQSDRVSAAAAAVAAAERRSGSSAAAAAATAPAQAPAPVPLEAVLVWESSRRGREAVRHDRHSACHAVLWLNRGVCFVQRMMSEVAHSPSTPNMAALEAYNATLRPYHGFLLSQVFRLALHFAPHDRLILMHRFGWATDAEAVEDLRACVAALQPITSAVSRALAAHQLDFKDKVGTVLPSSSPGPMQ